MPLPLTLAVDPARAALGEQLFQDVRPCGQNTVACATCHQLALGGADGHPQALGANGTPLLRNTPTVFNVAFNFSYHWDGAVPTLEAQAERVLPNPAVMHTTWPEILGKLRADPNYAATFLMHAPGPTVGNGGHRPGKPDARPGVTPLPRSHGSRRGGWKSTAQSSWGVTRASANDRR